ncbi:regulatory GntR family protein [Lentzea atacamensis]|uniref:Regulatory GntR family protein n=2 Tax=Lentzea TaxID=165301 RepID=A0ABX9DU65_9PSEU|nr:winged helix-turn-helix domain-containing protein [Lentzea atacamensis]RAS57102.1 regulatory GntR family protein [Lentzea atacamensis]
MGKRDPNDARPPYLQVVDLITRAIGAGEYAPGDQLPALHVLAETYGVAVGTVRSALNMLRDKDIVVVRPGSGTFVRSDLNPADLAEPLPPTRSGDLGEVLRLLHEISGRLADIERRLPVE